MSFVLNVREIKWATEFHVLLCSIKYFLWTGRRLICDGLPFASELFLKAWPFHQARRRYEKRLDFSPQTFALPRYSLMLLELVCPPGIYLDGRQDGGGKTGHSDQHPDPYFGLLL